MRCRARRCRRHCQRWQLRRAASQLPDTRLPSCRPLQPPLQLPTSDRAAGKLEQLVEDAARLLNELTGISAAEGETARPPAMPLTAITHAQVRAGRVASVHWRQC